MISMKKFVLFLSFVIVTTLCVFAYDNSFYSALQTCTHYVSTGNVNTEGMNVKVKEEILGKENNKCVYKETIDISGSKSCIVCRFTQNQINELIKVMKAYSTIQEYTGEEVDTSKLSAVQNNPVVKVWNKYLNDSTVCNIEIQK